MLRKHYTLLTIEVRDVEYVDEVVTVPDARLEGAAHEQVAVVAQQRGVDVHRRR